MMASPVLTLITPTTPPAAVDPETIRFLENLLASAKAGEINGVAVVTITSPHVGAYIGCGTCWAGDAVRQSVHTMLGGVDVLKQRMLNELFSWGG